ncbi:MAG: beta-N-acetylhexosaminidase [Treponema sp.]|jgi:hexosaminidase|nr:beta-N-acetylhexosaminidase [Treponema sp.]
MKAYTIIPKPRSIQYKQGNFKCTGIPQINVSAFQQEADVFIKQIQNTFGGQAFSETTDGITLMKADNSFGDIHKAESYRLEILSGGIRLGAQTQTGAFRGLQTLRQLFLSGYQNGELSIPCGIIEDFPRFSWRGLMLDCSRYFYSVEFIKKLLDALSLQHISIFHWHLTDDQGWRLPVKQYPLLTEIGSRRNEHRLWGSVTGGFYTEEEIRDIVSYAAQRHIEVVPEVDLPGHASSILAAYPGLGCTGGPYRVEDRYGVFEDVLCAGNDGIFPLFEAIFDTLAELFPSKYVHIGGDEVRFNRWKECPRCNKRFTELGLDNYAQMQSWITVRLAQMLRDRGRITIGWDEVLENTGKFPLPENVVVMSWRAQQGGAHAVSIGRRTIMSPQNEGCYLDYRHIDTPEEIGRLGIGTIFKGYYMNPITPQMSKDEASLVMGGQANLWSEVIYAGKIAEYMIFPRICGIAEALWSDEKTKDIEDFSKRLAVHQDRLDRLELLQYRGAIQ